MLPYFFETAKNKIIEEIINRNDELIQDEFTIFYKKKIIIKNKK